MNRYCTNCGTEVFSGATFCTGCGHKISRYCTNCGAESLERATFCTRCGSPVAPGGMPQQDQRLQQTAPDAQASTSPALPAAAQQPAPAAGVRPAQRHEEGSAGSRLMHRLRQAPISESIAVLVLAVVVATTTVAFAWPWLPPLRSQRPRRTGSRPPVTGRRRCLRSADSPSPQESEDVLQ